MRSVPKLFLTSILGAFVFVLVVVVAALIMLNTGMGRSLLSREVAALSGGRVRVKGLSGHFPGVIAARQITVADSKGVYLTIDSARLRWSAASLLIGKFQIESLTAHRVDLARLPAQSMSRSRRRAVLPKRWRPLLNMQASELAIKAFDIGRHVFGQKLALKIQGSFSLHRAKSLNVTLTARALDGEGDYHVYGALRGHRVDAQLVVHDTDQGPISRLAKFVLPQGISGPINVRMHLAGPSSDVRLDLAAAIGPTEVIAKGTASFTDRLVSSDLTVNIPDLAPAAALIGQRITGSSAMHLVATYRGGRANFHIEDVLDVKSGTGLISRFLGPKSSLSAHFSVMGSGITVDHCELTAPYLRANLLGSIRKKINLAVGITVPEIRRMDPALSGKLTGMAKLTGGRNRQRLTGTLTGWIAPAKGHSGPFSLSVDFQNRSGNYRGTVQGRGQLLGGPVTLRSGVVRTADGVTTATVETLRWRSLTASGTLKFTRNEPVPLGRLRIQMKKLTELNPFVRIGLRGGISAIFVRRAGAPASFSIDGKRIGLGRNVAIGDVSIDGSLLSHPAKATIQAHIRLSKATAGSVVVRKMNGVVEGSMARFAVQAGGEVRIAKGEESQIRIAGEVDLHSQNAKISRFGLRNKAASLELREPAEISMTNGLLVHLTGLSINGPSGTGAISVNGRVMPKLDLDFEIRQFPIALVKSVDKRVAVTGVADIAGKFTGPLAAPSGRILLHATGLGVGSGGGSKLPRGTISMHATLDGRKIHGRIAGILGGGRLHIEGSIPITAGGPFDMSFRLDALPAAVASYVNPAWRATGTVSGSGDMTGTTNAVRGTVQIDAHGLHLTEGKAALLPPIDVDTRDTLSGSLIHGHVTVDAGAKMHLDLRGTIQLGQTRTVNLGIFGDVDLALLNPMTEAQGLWVAGSVRPDLIIRGRVMAPNVTGSMVITGASVRDFSSGLDLANVDVRVTAAGSKINLARLGANAGHGRITASGSVGLRGLVPVALHLQLDHASPVRNDIVSEVLSGDLNLVGTVRRGVDLAGTIVVDSADITIPEGLPASVSKLTIVRPGQKKPVSRISLPAVRLNLNVIAKNRIFVRGHGILADLGGRLHFGGTVSKPIPSGELSLILGHFDLGGKTLRFTKGHIAFNGLGLMPVLDLEATHVSTDGTSSTLAVTGTPMAPKITLSSVPYLPSDEVLAHLLYNTSTQNLSPFQAASLATSLAQLAGIGGGVSPLGRIRSVLGLDELSLGGGSDGTGAPTINAGRYVAPGVYVGARQSASGQAPQVNVQINLFRGLKLNSTLSNGTGANASGGENVGLSYQFDY